MPEQSVPQHLSPRFTGTAALLAACTVLLTGCGGSTQDIMESLGLVRASPDEFVVTTRAPLQMPSQFTLPPPQPGMSRPQEQTERRQAEAALVPETALATTPPSGTSPGQQAIVSAAGPTPPTNIRAQVNAEVGLDKPHRTLTDRLMFWKDPGPPGTLVDPAREAQRLRQNAALGQSAETGDTPVVQPKRSSILGDIF